MELQTIVPEHPHPINDYSWMWTGVIVPILLAWFAWRQHKKREK